MKPFLHLSEYEMSDRQLKLVEQAREMREAQLTAVHAEFMHDLSHSDLIDAIDSMSDPVANELIHAVQIGDTAEAGRLLVTAVTRLANEYADGDAQTLDEIIENLQSPEVA